MKKMQKFYENWQMYDPNSSVMTDDYNSASVLVELEFNKSTNVIDELDFYFGPSGLRSERFYKP